MHLDFPDMRTGYVELGHAILERGRWVAPRGESTLEVLGCSFTLHDPHQAWTGGVGRNPVAALAAVEALQLIGGVHDPAALVAASPAFSAFLGPDGRQRAAYGPRVVDRVGYAVGQLLADPDSRRAIVSIWEDDDHVDGHPDYPCTMSWQFMVRDGRLHMFVNMRSNDFWRGVPYDVFMFTRVQITLAEVLGVTAGPYHHHAASMHVYSQHVDHVKELTPAPTHVGTRMGSVDGTGGWRVASGRARLLHDGVTLAVETDGERWMRERMRHV